MQRLFKSVFVPMLCGLLTLAAQGVADVLPFSAGDAANYTLSQKVDLQVDCLGMIFGGSTEIDLNLNVRILSCEGDTSSYPFEVEVVVKDGKITETSLNEPDYTVVDDSLVKKLTDHPLQYHVDGDYNVTETSGYLAAALQHDYSSSGNALKSTLELFLTQLFQLSGENLVEGSTVPMSCSQLVNWGTSREDCIEQVVDQSGQYTIATVESDKLPATWQGSAQLADEEREITGAVSAQGSAVWELLQPMVQQRDMSAQVEIHNGGYIPTVFNINLEQSFSGTAL